MDGQYISVDDGVPRNKVEELNLLNQWVVEGKIKAVLDRIHSLEEMVEAHRYVDQGHKKGNVVITVGH